jgi:hypothetical protein
MLYRHHRRERLRRRRHHGNIEKSLWYKSVSKAFLLLKIVIGINFPDDLFGFFDAAIISGL